MSLLFLLTSKRWINELRREPLKRWIWLTDYHFLHFLCELMLLICFESRMMIYSCIYVIDVRSVRNEFTSFFLPQLQSNLDLFLFFIMISLDFMLPFRLGLFGVTIIFKRCLRTIIFLWHQRKKILAITDLLFKRMGFFIFILILEVHLFLFIWIFIPLLSFYYSLSTKCLWEWYELGFWTIVFGR